MMSRRGVVRERIARMLWAVLPVVAMGAGPSEPWETVRATLPPVAIAPGAPGVPNRAVAPARPLPLPMPARPDRGVIPAANQVPVVSKPLAPSVPSQMGSQSAAGAPMQNFASPNTRVYIINGIDLFGMGGLSQMADRIRESGYPATRFGGWYQVLQFDREIRAAYRQDPSAQFVIIGYSYGVYRARALANRLTRDGIPIAMVGYIGGDYLRNSPTSQPVGVGRVVNVMGDGYMFTGRNLFWNGTDLNGADNVRMPGVRHFNLPKQEQTLGALVNGLNSVSSRTWTSPVASSPSGVPGRIAVGPEILPQPTITSASSPIYTTGRR